VTALWDPTAGNPPTAAQFATLIPKYARRSTDATLSTTSLTADGTLFLPNLSINVEYECMAYLLHRSAGSVSISVDFTVPTGATLDNASFQIVSGGSTFGVTGASGSVTGIGNTTSNRPTYIRFVLVMGSTSGTLQLRWACGSASAVVLATGSYLVAHQVT
jgi:hypothetical protein